jgi:hypothetical protein
MGSAGYGVCPSNIQIAYRIGPEARSFNRKRGEIRQSLCKSPYRV